WWAWDCSRSRPWDPRAWPRSYTSGSDAAPTARTPPSAPPARGTPDDPSGQGARGDDGRVPRVAAARLAVAEADRRGLAVRHPAYRSDRGAHPLRRAQPPDAALPRGRCGAVGAGA